MTHAQRRRRAKAADRRERLRARLAWLRAKGRVVERVIVFGRGRYVETLSRDGRPAGLVRVA